MAVAIPSLLPDAAQEIGRKYQQFSVYEYGKMGKHAVICAERGREVVMSRMVGAREWVWVSGFRGRER